MMLEERYNRMMAQVEPSDALVRKTLAAARPGPRQPSARRALLLAALCVLVVALPVLWKVLTTLPEPPKVTSADPMPTFTALPVRPLSDELTLTVSDVQWEDDATLTFLLTMRGDKVDASTEFDFTTEGLPLYMSTSKRIDPIEGQPENELRRKIILTLSEDERLWRGKIPETLPLHINRYTSGNTSYERLHDIDWAAFEYTLEEAGSPIIDLGGGMSITGIGFNQDEHLTVQIRVPADAKEPTHSLPLVLVEKEDGKLKTDFYPWTSNQQYVGDFIYCTTSMSVTREQLDGVTLATNTFIAGETIYGDWSVTVDIPPHPSE